MKKIEQAFYEQEQNLQQKEREFEMKKEWDKDNKANIIHQPLNRANSNIFLQVQLIIREKNS